MNLRTVRLAGRVHQKHVLWKNRQLNTEGSPFLCTPKHQLRLSVMGNASCTYPSGVSKAARQSWSNADGEPRIFTPWDTQDCPGVHLEDGLVLPKKAVRFLLGDAAQIPDFIPSSPRFKRCQSVDPAKLKGILIKSSAISNVHVLIKQPPKRRHRRVRSLTRRISNSKVEVIPYYFTKRGIPAAVQIVVGNSSRPSTETDDCKVETARRTSIDLLDSERKQDADSLQLQDSLESYSSDNIEQGETLFSDFINLQTLKQECVMSEKKPLQSTNQEQTECC